MTNNKNTEDSKLEKNQKPNKGIRKSYKPIQDKKIENRTIWKKIKK